MREIKAFIRVNMVDKVVQALEAAVHIRSGPEMVGSLPALEDAG
jgi:hypothetical protein